MKKYISIFLVLLMLAAALTSCLQKPDKTKGPGATAPSEQSGVSPTGDPSGGETPTPSAPTTPEPEPEIVLPSSSSLLDTVHMPNVDNQGSIGSCTSEGVTFTQFTIAVSQYMHYLDPDTDWNPGSWNADYIFSPKFTFNLSGPSTDGCYKILRDNGCLPMSVCVCEKSRNTDKRYWGGSNVLAKKSRAWEVGEGMMLRALKFRITNYYENEYMSTVGGKLTTSDQGLEILKKVKEAVYRGNAVACCGWSSYWRGTYSATIDSDGLGTLGKEGDYVIWNGFKAVDSKDDGNHCIAIIGYDDDITFTYDGVTMKGAFLIRNSWGSWCNEGNCWMMYDAFNKDSEYEIFNDPYFYKPTFALAVSDKKVYAPLNDQGALETSFTRDGEVTLGEKTYPTYKISDGKKYLSYSGGALDVTNDAEKAALFALIPYADMNEGPAGEYQRSYYLYAASVGGEALWLSVDGVRSGAEADLTASVEDPAAVCWNVGSYDASKEAFTSLVCLKHYEGGTEYERTGTMYRFSFLYWDEDIAVGLPDVSVEVEVTGIDRNNLVIYLTRTDVNGVQQTYCPASIDLRYNEGLLPDLNLDRDEILSFSGKSNPTEPETGFFAYGYMALADFGGDLSIDDFLWGVNVKGTDITVKSIKLIDKDGNVISKITMPEDTPALTRGETYSYVFDQGNELKTYFGPGSYYLKNVGTGKLLSLAANNMTFEWQKGKKIDPQKTAFNFVFDGKNDEVRIYRYGSDNMLFDVMGKEIKDDVMVKLNAANPARTGQSWVVDFDGNGYLTLRLKNHPDYAFGCKGTSDFCISSTDRSDNFKWIPVLPSDPTLSMKCTQEGGTVTVRVRAPENYEDGTAKLRVVKDGEVIDTVDLALNDKELTAALTLEAGVYLFSAMIDGAPFDTQTILTVK